LQPFDRDALVVAMTIVPGLYSRNKMFAFFNDPEIRRARARAAQLRGIVRQLAGSQGAPAIVELSRAHRGSPAAAAPAVLCFSIPLIRLVRRVELSELEAACLAYLCARAGVTCLHPEPDDRVMLDSALRKLAGGLNVAGFDKLAPATALPSAKTPSSSAPSGEPRAPS
jgi:hypothetical protein